MKHRQLLLLLLILIATLPLPAQTGDLSERREVFAPFVSRFKAEPKGSAILLTWQDARNLTNPVYHIYESEIPLSKADFPSAKRVATVSQGEESFLFEPGDGGDRYFLVLAEDEGNLYDLFIPYRNMTMTPSAAVLQVLEEEQAALLSNIKVIPEEQVLIISGRSTRPERPVLLFRSTEPINEREDLAKAARLKTFRNESILIRDHVLPGIPFYYALVDQGVYESGSEALLYEGSVTLIPVVIPMEEWNPSDAHMFQYSSRHIPLPVLNVRNDIEKGMPLPGPAIPDNPVELTMETALSLAELDFGKSVRTVLWYEPQILPADKSGPSADETAGIPELLEDREWKSVLERTTQELESTFDPEIRARLSYYRGQSRYFLGDLEYAFMDFLSSRELYFSESTEWLYSIFQLKRQESRTEEAEY